MNDDDPGLQTRCPKCRAEFSVPDIREPDNLQRLDYHCPKCGYHYAQWPKVSNADTDHQVR